MLRRNEQEEGGSQADSLILYLARDGSLHFAPEIAESNWKVRARDGFLVRSVANKRPGFQSLLSITDEEKNTVKLKRHPLKNSLSIVPEIQKNI